MVSVGTWCRYVAHKFAYSLSIGWKVCNGSHRCLCVVSWLHLLVFFIFLLSHCDSAHLIWACTYGGLCCQRRVLFVNAGIICLPSCRFSLCRPCTVTISSLFLCARIILSCFRQGRQGLREMEDSGTSGRVLTRLPMRCNHFLPNKTLSLPFLFVILMLRMCNSTSSSSNPFKLSFPYIPHLGTSRKT